MKRKQYSLILLLVIGVVLGTTWPWWLPWLLSQLQWFEERSALLQGLNAFVGLP